MRQQPSIFMSTVNNDAKTEEKMPVNIVCVRLIYAINHTFISTIPKYKWMCVSPLWLWLWLCLCLAFARYFILTALSSRWTLIHIVFQTDIQAESTFAYRGFLSNARANRWTFYMLSSESTLKNLFYYNKNIFYSFKLSLLAKNTHMRVTHFFFCYNIFHVMHCI